MYTPPLVVETTEWERGFQARDMASDDWTTSNQTQRSDWVGVVILHGALDCLSKHSQDHKHFISTRVGCFARDDQKKNRLLREGRMILDRVIGKMRTVIQVLKTRIVETIQRLTFWCLAMKVTVPTPREMMAKETRRAILASLVLPSYCSVLVEEQRTPSFRRATLNPSPSSRGRAAALF